MAFLQDADASVPLDETTAAISDLKRKRNLALDTAAATTDIYCAHSRVTQDTYSRPLYEELAQLLLPHKETAQISERDMEDAHARLGVNVESQTQAGLVKVVSALNVCKRCLSSGATDEESRNVTSRMRYMHSWDEPGVEFLTCQRCGHSWKR